MGRKPAPKETAVIEAEKRFEVVEWARDGTVTIGFGLCEGPRHNSNNNNYKCVSVNTASSVAGYDGFCSIREMDGTIEVKLVAVFY